MIALAPIALDFQLVDGESNLIKQAGYDGIFFVDSNSGNSDNDAGRTPASSVITLDAGINLCTANSGHTVVMLPGHAENITTATGINADTAGINIIGLGHGSAIPTISFTAAEGSITVGAAGVLLQNFKLVANFNGGTTAGITIAAAGDQCTCDGIIMRDTSTANEFLLHYTIATGVDDLTISNNDIVCLAGSATNSILFAGTSTNFRLIDNYIYGDTTDSVVDHLVGAATTCLLKGNVIHNEDDQTAGFVFDFNASSTGHAVNNRGSYNKNDAAMTKGDAMWWVENYFSNTIAESGILEPAATHVIP